MKTLNVIGMIVPVTLIALAGIAIVAATTSLPAQSINATTDVMTITTSVGEEGKKPRVSRILPTTPTVFQVLF